MYNVIIVCLKYFDAVFWRQEGYMAYKNFYFKTSCEAINVSGCDSAQNLLASEHFYSLFCEDAKDQDDWILRKLAVKGCV